MHDLVAGTVVVDVDAGGPGGGSRYRGVIVAGVIVLLAAGFVLCLLPWDLIT
ncbi:hypothetical protein [Sphaerisporangium fuscum]|uniref:hypothetical protein n=1 Tax=Sphaerisporangium fuscum TaxID=2835868 RepID=UPI001BDCB18F|nr:hypothetical protein [Sphaerisporangium fuscum]